MKEKNPEVWTIENLEKLAGRNLVRVFTEAEKVRDSLINKVPDDSVLPTEPAEEEKPPEEEKPADPGSSATGLAAQILLYLTVLFIMYM